MTIASPAPVTAAFTAGVWVAPDAARPPAGGADVPAPIPAGSLPTDSATAAVPFAAAPPAGGAVHDTRPTAALLPAGFFEDEFTLNGVAVG